jgi:hypothetical protein
MMVTMAGHLMALGDDRRHRFRIALGDTAAGHERRPHFMGCENTQDAPNTGIGTILRLSIFLVIHLAVFIRPDIFTALKIEAEKDRHPGIAGPMNLAIGMDFLNRHNQPPYAYPLLFDLPKMNASVLLIIQSATHRKLNPRFAL